ncbi:MAG: disulfide bond formation protein B [Pseudomonadota bacterium]
MSVYGRILLAGLGSLGLLLGALAFQYIGGLDPCVMCIWQRWPHLAAVSISVLAMTVMWRMRRPLAALGALAVGISAAIGIYHVGVEQGLWTGPGTCSGGANPAELSTEDLLAQLESASLVRCDEVAWDFLGISMAGWNAILSLGLGVLWVLAALSKTTTKHETRPEPSR